MRLIDTVCVKVGVGAAGTGSTDLGRGLECGDGACGLGWGWV